MGTGRATMGSMRRRLMASTAAFILAAASVFAQAGAIPSLKKTDADSLEKKIAAVIARGAANDPAPRPLRTTITEREVNAYFKFQGAEQLPAGVVNPTLSILDAGRVSGVV